MKITRREWVGALAAGAAGAAAGIQEKAETPEELRKAAGERLRRNAGALAKIPIPMATEPAFVFKAQ
jgi:hypothetical protein